MRKNTWIPSKAAKTLQFLGIAMNMSLLTYFGLWPMAVLMGFIAVPAGVAACFSSPRSVAISR